MNHDRILKALLRHNVFRTNSLAYKIHQLFSRIIRCLAQFRSCCRHQSRSRKHQTKSLRHNLHRRCRSHKGAGTTARAGILLVVIKLFDRNLPALFLRIKLSDLLKRQEFIDCASRIILDIFRSNLVCLHHASGHNNRTHLLEFSDSHQHCRHRLITACNKHSSVKSDRISVNLNHVRNHITACQRIIDSVMSLRNSITDICCVIARCLSACILHTTDCLLYKLVEMGTSRMAVSKRALHKNLRFREILLRPSHSNFQRVIFRCQFPNCLTIQFHMIVLHTFALLLLMIFLIIHQTF